MALTPTVLNPTAYGAAPLVNPTTYTLSTDNLTITGTSQGTQWGQVYCDNPQASGNYYAEVTLDTSNYMVVGVGATSQLTTTEMDKSGVGCAHVFFNGFVYLGNDYANVYLGNFAVGDVLGVAVALPNQVWFRRNGGLWNASATADPASGTGGISLATLAAPFVLLVEAITPAALTANFGQSAFAFAAPAGFDVWPGAETVAITAASGFQGNPVVLSGITNNGQASGLDYSLDGGTTWTACTSYAINGDGTWTCKGPTFPGAAFGYIQVRDNGHQSVVSPAFAFQAGGRAPSPVYLFDDEFAYTAPAGPAMQGAGWSLATEQQSPPWADNGSLFLGGQNPGAPPNDTIHNAQARHAFGPAPDILVTFAYEVQQMGGQPFQFQVSAGDIANSILSVTFNLDTGGNITPDSGYLQLPDGSYTTVSHPQNAECAIRLKASATANTYAYSVAFNGTLASAGEVTLTSPPPAAGTFGFSVGNIFPVTNGKLHYAVVHSMRVYDMSKAGTRRFSITNLIL